MIDRSKADIALVTSFPREFLEEYAVAPFSRGPGVLTILGPESARGAAYEIGMLTGEAVDFTLTDAAEVRAFIREMHDRGTSLRDAIEEHGEDEDSKTLSDDSPVARTVDDLLARAVERRASDVHIEPYEGDSRVRMRVDGTLLELETLPRSLHPVVVSRVKIMAKLKIEERRLPQDGRIPRLVAGRQIDLRVSTIPTGFGERVVLRILDRSSVRYGVEETGMTGEILRKWTEVIAAPHGIVLVTGPTGSGKTTTLYAALETLNDGKVNILTVEDPVEYQMEGLGQTQVNEKIGLTFAAALRSILRQDPDIVMIGEIRDVETARIAVQASLTGHLVLSTLHTNDSFSAAPRLRDMGVEPYLLGSTLKAVLAQRLVRKLCPACRVESLLSEAEALVLGASPGEKVFEAKGCAACDNLGFRGRVGIFEFLVVEGEVRELILKGESSPRIAEAARRAGVKTLRDSGCEAVLRGLTTADEVIQATEEG